MAYKQSPWSGYQKPGPPSKQVPLSKHEEKKGTQITGGNKSEEMVDLEDRIEFLNSDLQGEKSIMKRGKIITQLNKLKARLKKMKTKTKKVDPDAPGTPGTAGYEPPVKRSDLDEEGKKIWDSKRK